MTDTNHLCDLWEHILAKVFKHDSKSQMGLMLKQWIIFNKLENFNSILNYTIDDFTPSGILSYMNQHGDILHHTPMREVLNLRCYIQHLTEFRQPLQVQSHLEMPGILVQLGHIQCT